MKREDIINVSETLRIELQEWQLEVILDKIRKRWCLNCGRKSGKTTAIEFRCADELIDGDCRGVGLSGGICVLSKGERQAKEILNGVKNILNGLGWEFSKERANMSAEKKIAYAAAKELQMPNGNRMLALPAGTSGDSVRPYSFHLLIFDEADFIPDEVYVSVLPCLARFNGIEILESTPNPVGTRNSHFAKAFFGKIPGYQVMCIPTSMAPHITHEWLMEQKHSMSSADYAREYECKFSSAVDGVFPQRLVDECTRSAESWDLLASNADSIFLGVSFARFDTEDSIIAINYHFQGVNYIKLKIIPGRGTKIMAVEDELKNMIAANSRISKLVVDDRSMGTGPTQGLTDMFGASMVIAVSSHKVLKDTEGGRSRYQKEDLYVNLLKLMERGKVILDADPRIANALMDTKYEYYHKGGMVRIWNEDPGVTEAITRSVFPIWGSPIWLDDVKDAIIVRKS